MGIEKIKVPNHSAEKKVFSAQLDKNLVERFDETASRYGWGSKRRLVEYALNKVLDELQNDK